MVDMFMFMFMFMSRRSSYCVAPVLRSGDALAPRRAWKRSNNDRSMSPGMLYLRGKSDYVDCVEMRRDEMRQSWFVTMKAITTGNSPSPACVMRGCASQRPNPTSWLVLRISTSYRESVEQGFWLLVIENKVGIISITINKVTL